MGVILIKKTTAQEEGAGISAFGSQNERDPHGPTISDLFFQNNPGKRPWLLWCVAVNVLSGRGEMVIWIGLKR